MPDKKPDQMNIGEELFALMKQLHISRPEPIIVSVGIATFVDEDGRVRYCFSAIGEEIPGTTTSYGNIQDALCEALTWNRCASQGKAVANNDSELEKMDARATVSHKPTKLN